MSFLQSRLLVRLAKRTPGRNLYLKEPWGAKEADKYAFRPGLGLKREFRNKNQLGILKIGNEIPGSGFPVESY
jgi:hypothetical protein